MVTVMTCMSPRRRIREAPDTGYAWVVAIAACLINFIVAGLGRMSGILYVAFIDNFHVTRQEATAPFSIRSSIRNLLGPVVGILGQQYGVRSVTVAGGIISSISAVGCFLAPDMLWITIIWGVLNGIGTALATTLPQVIINQYFEKHHTTASGMAFSGGCIGSFIFPVLLEYLIYAYGVQGTFLVMGGIIMHVIPAAIMLRRPAWLEHKVPIEVEQETAVNIATVTFSNEGCLQSVGDGSQNCVNTVNAERSECNRDPKAAGNCDTVSLTDETSNKIDICNKLEGADVEGSQPVGTDNDGTKDVNSIQETRSLNCSVNDETPASAENVEDQQTKDVPAAIAEQVAVLLELPTTQGPTDIGGGFLKHIKTFVKLNGNPLFLLICLCRAVHFISFIPVVTVIVDYGMDKGLREQDGKYTIAAFSIGDLIGRLCLGWLNDGGYITLPKFMLVVMILQGITTATFPHLWGMASILPMVALFGLLQGSVFVRHPVLVSKYMGANEQSIATGSINFLSGLLGFTLPYFIGYFRDTLGSYDNMFYITGAIGSLVGSLWVLEPYIVRYSRKDL